MLKSDFKIIIISPPDNISNEIESLAQLFENSLETFHLRKPTYSLKQMQHYLNKIPSKFHSKIVIHSNYELMNQFNLKGIHLTEQKRKIIGSTQELRVISTSFHSLNIWEKEHNDYEYSFISPVFNSISKHNHSANFNYVELGNHLKKHKTAVTIALGGICLSNIQKTINLGFNGAAMIGYIWQSKNPIKAFQKMSESARNL